MQIRAASFIFCLASLFFAAGGDALADKRVALVIGNSAYKHAAKLPNPANDAAAISVLFRTAGFDVVESRENLSGNEMRKAIRDFTDKVRDVDIAVVFYAGHGIEFDGVNYLLPVDAALERDLDVEDEAISLDRIVRMLDSAKRLRLVILDACRDNPFAKTMKRSAGTRSVGRGLAKIEPNSSDTLVAFAAKAGSTASDGNGKNSPFTMALLSNIATPGLDLRIAFGRVRDEVLKNTGNRQEPFVYGSLGGTTVALVPTAADIVAPTATAPAVTMPAPNFNSTADIRRDYELASQIGTKKAWEAFLATHSIGYYADLAHEQLGKITAEDAKKAKPPQTASKPEPSQAAPPAAPKSAEAQRSSGRMACNKYGCQEVKPGCRVEKFHAGAVQEDVVVCK